MEHVARKLRDDVHFHEHGHACKIGVSFESARPPFKSLVGLQQIIAESLGRGVNTKGVLKKYLDIVGEFGGELAVLLEAPSSDLTRTAGERIAEGIGRVRRGDISIVPGYDGRFGRVSVWPDE